MKEIELRFALDRRDAFEQVLAQMGARYVGSETQHDIYYKIKGHEHEGDDPGSTIYRLRKLNDRTLFTRKTTIESGVWDEHEVELPFHHTSFFLDFLDNVLSRVLDIAKQRDIHIWKSITICLDDVRSLGTFAEMEVLYDGEDIATGREILKNAARIFGLADSSLVTDGYVTLMKRVQSER